jgi:hypothetical protein
LLHVEIRWLSTGKESLLWFDNIVGFCSKTTGRPTSLKSERWQA